jgi:hypothetical protein
MPTIYANVDVDVDFEIDEIVDSCSDREIKSLIKYLASAGHLSKFKVLDESRMTANEIEFNEQLIALSEKYYQMTVEEIKTIESLYNKYR